MEAAAAQLDVRLTSMGKVQGPYNADYPVGTRVRIAARDDLAAFLRPSWKYHHPLDPAMLQWAGETATVSAVAYYHGGDELYELKGVPGIWHEGCLSSAGAPAA